MVTNEERTTDRISNEVVSYTKFLPIKGSSRAENVLMPSQEGDDRLPSITRDKDGHTIVTWTNEQDISTWNMGIAYSDDPEDPMSWVGWIVALSGTTMVWYSDTAYVDGPNSEDFHGLYGVNFYYDVEQVGGYEILDITTDPSTWEYYYWDAFAGDQICRMVEDGGYYDEPYNKFQGPISMAIYHLTELGFDIMACPQYRNQDLTEGGSTTYFFDAQANLQTAPASDCDYATLPDTFHLTWQYYNATEDADKIVWKKIDPAVEADIEFTPWQEYVAYGTNPSIEAYVDGGNNHVAVVYANEGNVECVYSSDDGENWAGPVTVAAGSYPALRAIGKNLYCAYIDGGNLYLKISEDGGMTWGAAEQINDEPGTVVAEENAVDIHAGGIVWVDERGTDLDIYFAPLDIGEAPGIPTIDGPANGNTGQTLTYTFNAIDPDGDDVKFIIDWGDSNSDTTDFVASGADQTASHSWDSEKTYTITVKAEDIYGNIGPEGTFSVTIPRDKTTYTSLFLRFLQNHPNMFPILQYILGLK